MCLGRVDAMNHRANWVPLSGIVVGTIALFICCEAEFANSAVRQDRFPSFPENSRIPCLLLLSYSACVKSGGNSKRKQTLTHIVAVVTGVVQRFQNIDHGCRRSFSLSHNRFCPLTPPRIGCSPTAPDSSSPPHSEFPSTASARNFSIGN